MKIDLKCFTRTYAKPNKIKGLLQISCKLDSNNLILSSRLFTTNKPCKSRFYHFNEPYLNHIIRILQVIVKTYKLDLYDSTTASTCSSVKNE